MSLRRNIAACATRAVNLIQKDYVAGFAGNNYSFLVDLYADCHELDGESGGFYGAHDLFLFINVPFFRRECHGSAAADAEAGSNDENSASNVDVDDIAVAASVAE